MPWANAETVELRSAVANAWAAAVWASARARPKQTAAIEVPKRMRVGVEKSLCDCGTWAIEDEFRVAILTASALQESTDTLLKYDSAKQS
jgi:hypothetical protein